MYCGHFGFSEKPFDMTPDPKYLYLNHNNKEVFAALKYGIRDRRGFISIIGEVGTGKTTLLNAALDQLDENTKAAYIFNTSVTFDKILATTLFELGLKKSDESLSKIHAIERLNNFAIEQLTAGGNVALIIDEAQNLDMKSLENLRLLSNLETRKHKLIQIVIAGQPELDVILQRQELRQLTQRINLNRYLIPLSEKETNDYIQHRLIIADYKGPNLFDRRAQKLIWEFSHGIPRKINILCDNALLTGYGVKKRRITTSLMEEAIKDLTRTPIVPSGAPANQNATHKIGRHRQETTGLLPRRWSLAAGLALMAVIIFGLGLIMGNPDLGWRENITRLSQRVFPSQKTSQGGGAGGIPTTELAGKDIQAKLNQAIKASPVLTEKVKTEPVPAGMTKDVPAPTEAVKTASISTEKGGVEPAPAEMAKDASAPAEKVETGRVPAESLVTPSVPDDKPEVIPAPTLEVATGPAQAEEVESAPAPAEEKVMAPDVPEDKVSPISTAAVSQPNVLPESVGATEQIKKEDATITKEEPTEKSDGSPLFESPREELQLALSIRPGDTLTAIIIQHYGAYNKETLRAVLHENPEIQDPDLIIAGEILRLPLPSEKP
ncbi:MAG: AAA family ATPase [Desulfobacterales bacterium]|jgi:type II secretory pathway predicted ATPase ExeA